MHLSKRLQMVADCVSQGSLVADVGCDHAYISIYLVENEIAHRCVALDINEGPLLRAKANVKEYGYEDKIAIRLSDGLKKLCPGEANSIVIAGMGGILMVRILSEGYALVNQAKELILQPQSEAVKVREYLHKFGFIICEENMCIDDGKYYVVIHAKKAEVIESNDESCIIQKRANEIQLSLKQRAHNKYGELLLREKHPILKEFLKKEYRTAKLIEINLLEHPSDNNNLRQEQIKEELAVLEYALSYYSY
jgi:tRNA (adenine22-N1)-methyltransferase